MWTEIFNENADYENDESDESDESDGGSDDDPDLLLLQLRSFPENTCQSISVRTIHCRSYRLWICSFIIDQMINEDDEYP